MVVAIKVLKLKAANIGVYRLCGGNFHTEGVLEVLGPMMAADSGHDRSYRLSLREKVGDPLVVKDWCGRQEAEDRAVRPDLFC